MDYSLKQLAYHGHIQGGLLCSSRNICPLVSALVGTSSYEKVYWVYEGFPHNAEASQGFGLASSRSRQRSDVDAKDCLQHIAEALIGMVPFVSAHIGKILVAWE